MLQSTKLERVVDLKSDLTSDLEMQDLEFSLLGFSLDLDHYFLTMAPFSYFFFWNVDKYSMQLCIGNI